MQAPQYPSITPSQLARTLLLQAAIGKAVFLTGPSGVGKSECVRACGRDPKLKALAWSQWAKATGNPIPEPLPDLEVFQTNLNGKEAEDLTGLPWLQVVPGTDGRITRYAPPHFLRHERPVILFLDEVTGLENRIQKVLLQIIHERRMDDVMLPEGTIIILAGNQSTDRAAVRQILFTLGNRAAHYSFVASPEDWIVMARSRGLHPAFHAWVAEKGLDGLHGYKQSDPSLAQLTPRSLEAAALAYDVDRTLGLDQEDIDKAITAHVGWGAGTELLEFLRLIDVLPKWEEILRAPDEAPLPEDGHIDQVYYIATAILSHLTKEKSTVEAAAAAGTYLARMSAAVPSTSDAVSWFLTQFLKEHPMTEPVAVATLKSIKTGNPKLARLLKEMAA